MSSLRWWCAALLALVVVIQKVRGHGRLWEPPGRSTMWRSGFLTPPNYDDTGLNCGGRDHQWNVNGGMCGVCGDPWDKPPPRDNEDGGKYGTGIITRTYSPGQDIAVRLEITANHLGWFEFRICPQNDPKIPVTQECLDEYLLQLSDGSGTRFTLGPGIQIVEYNVSLPRDLTCSKCVVQWKWRAGNNYGGDQMHQEEFYACSDVAIGTSATTGPATNTPRPSVSTPPSFQPITQTIRPPPGTPTAAGPYQTCRAKGLWAGNPTMDEWCTETCVPSQVCSPQYCECSQVLITHQVTGAPTHSPFTTTMQATSPTTLTSPTTVLLTPPPVTIHPTSLPVITSGLHCYAVGAWAGNEDFDRRCQQSCTTSLECDPQLCHCEERTVTQQSIHTTTYALTTNTPFQPLTTPTQTSTASTTLKTVPTTTVLLSSQPQTHCFAIGAWAGKENLDLWCEQTCTMFACDPQYCQCEQSPHTQQVTNPTYQAQTVTLVPTTRQTPPPTQSVVQTLPTSTSSPTTTTVQLTTPATESPRQQCRALGSWAGQPRMDLWCTEACAGHECNPQLCSCDQSTQITHHDTSPITHTPTYPAYQPITNPTEVPRQTSSSVPQGGSPLRCHGVGPWEGIPNLDIWCTEACANVGCDAVYCSCH